MTDTNRAANTVELDFTATKHLERKSTGLLECAIVSVAGLAITLLAITHNVPNALQLTVMQ